MTMTINTQMDAAHAELALSNAIMNAAPKDTPDNPFIEPELVSSASESLCQTEGDIGGEPM